MPTCKELCGNLSSRTLRWVVTGGAGFIGSHLVESLLSLGQKVTVLDNFLSGRESNVEEARKLSTGRDPRFRLLKGDIRDMEQCREACHGADIVLHHAALVSVPRSFQEPHLNNSCNITGFLNMLTAARDEGVRSFVYASSAAVYGHQPEGPTGEDAPLSPLSPYAVAKRTDELYASVLSGGMRTTGLRYMNVFGPRQDPSSPYSGVISIWSRCLMDGEPPVIYGDGKTTRDFVYVGDVVQANLLAALSDLRSGDDENIFNIGTGRPVSLEKAFLAMSGAIESLCPGWKGKEPVHEPERMGDIRYSLADISRARELLGYEPRYSLEEGLVLTIKSFMNSRM
ncbi:MAG: SDR family oxidoreductase [Thermovirgaceae bacterium]|jgi:UDP-N-acetylglucosamine 4-epimerase|nr:SDR family oxidoreductase [Synergistales bacterium]MDI9392392.1 SDR family oxidoreductase [Synergistota bacterium]MDY0178489.1 SDR family oxidoreductase [Synergistaceae bacterium]HOP51448.1 SDR family oxidoreductase [Synergistales bacterium]